MTRRTLLRLLLVATVAAAAAPAQAATFSRASAHVTNHWFPLKPGTTLVYAGESDGNKARDVFRVTHRVTTIDGIRCATIDDRVYMGGKLRERTTDYYAQATNGD